MGLEINFLNDLTNLKQRGALDGFSSVVEIGAQQLFNWFLRSNETLSKCYAAFNKPHIELGSPTEVGATDGVEHQSEENPSSRAFWQSIGFRYTSIEFDGHRDSVALDLNCGRVPRDMRGTFELIVNAGTTEHVANQENAFRVMHDLCKVGGVIYHFLPAGGMMNHGLVTYTPKFFLLLCRENDYECLIFRVADHPANPVPQDIRDTNMQFCGYDAISADRLVPDFSIAVAIRKKHDRPFVTPLDIPAELARKGNFRLKNLYSRLRRAVSVGFGLLGPR